MSALAMKPYILTASGGHFNFVEPDASEYVIEDIAQGLCSAPRFAGQTKAGLRAVYSVAQHCVLAAAMCVNPSAQPSVLLHDAFEAFGCDIPSPLKQLMPEYKAIERRCMESIFNKFGVTPYPAVINYLDLRMLATERRDLMPHDPRPWPSLYGVEPFPFVIDPWPHDVAYYTFLNLFRTSMERNHVAR